MASSADTKDAALKKLSEAGSFPTDGYLAINPNDDASRWKNHPKFAGAQVCGCVKGATGTRVLCRYKKGTIEPSHTHASRLEWVVISGKFKISNEKTGTEIELTAGAYWACPKDCPHKVECLEDGDVFVILDGEADFIPYSK